MRLFLYLTFYLIDTKELERAYLKLSVLPNELSSSETVFLPVGQQNYHRFGYYFAITYFAIAKTRTLTNNKKKLVGIGFVHIPGSKMSIIRFFEL